LNEKWLDLITLPLIYRFRLFRLPRHRAVGVNFLAQHTDSSRRKFLAPEKLSVWAKIFCWHKERKSSKPRNRNGTFYCGVSARVGSPLAVFAPSRQHRKKPEKKAMREPRELLNPVSSWSSRGKGAKIERFNCGFSSLLRLTRHNHILLAWNFMDYVN
jgi:hypothetical protein